MKVSNNGLNLIMKFEGCRLTAYQDAVGVWTIGYGHTSGVRKGQRITKEQAIEFLKQDCLKAEKNVNAYATRYNWNQNQFDALVSFAFNIGSINQLTANGKRSIAEISQKILAYNKAGGKVLKGLTDRRKAEKALFDKYVIPDKVAYFAVPKIQTDSIAKALESINEDGSYKYRCKIASKNKITGYMGTAEQNIYMLDLLKRGLLLKP